jgi:hypothetical protein
MLGASHLHVRAPRSLSFTHCLSNRSDMPKHTILSRGFALAITAGLLCAGAASAAVDTEADWQARKSASGVFYSQSFDFASKAELLDAAVGATGGGYTSSPPQNEIDLDSTIKLSGGKSLKIITHGASSANGGSWADWYDGKDGSTRYKTFYFQFAIYLPRATLAYRSKGGDGQLKLANLEQYGAAQIVVTNRNFLGFPTILLNGSGTLSKNISENSVPNVGSEYVYQPAVDSGSPSNPGDACEFWGRYGPSRGVATNDDYGETNSQPRLDLRNMTYGWPNRCALRSGVPFAVDGWTVVELYVEYNTANPQQSTLKGWAAPYGSAPRLFVNEVNTLQLGANSEVYHRFELLNYDTPRLAEPDRPTMYTYFDEVLISTSPIKFPGGFSLPSTSVRPNPPTSVHAD